MDKQVRPFLAEKRLWHLEMVSGRQQDLWPEVGYLGEGPEQAKVQAKPGVREKLTMTEWEKGFEKRGRYGNGF